MLKNKKVFIGILVSILLFFSLGAKLQEKYLYVKEEKENLRETPNGKKIGQLLQKTKVKVIEEKGNWVKVNIEGWIYKESLISDVSSIKLKTHKDEISAGNGFYYKNVSFRSSMMGNEVVGEIINKSGRNYQIANFILSVYDANDRLLETTYIIISNIPNGVTKSFQTFLLNTAISQVSSYKI